MSDKLGSIISNITSGNAAAHAYIVEGNPGETRGFFLKSLIKGILCESPDSNACACNKCRICKQIDADTCLDIVRMTRSGKTGYNTADAEDFIMRINMGSYGKRLVGVIDYADQLGEIIENKLLKTLEEPRGNAVILLATSNSNNLLSTVRSRCSILRMPELVDAESFVTDEAIADAAQISLNDFAGKNFYEFRTLVDKQIKSQEEALQLLGLMEDAFRNQMVEGKNMYENANATIIVEEARMDIYRGMSFGKALRRIYLELEG